MSDAMEKALRDIEENPRTPDVPLRWYDAWRSARLAWGATERDLSEAIRLLRAKEWSDLDDYHNDVCPWCGGEKPDRRDRKVYPVGHAPDCALAALLAKYPET